MSQTAKEGCEEESTFSDVRQSLPAEDGRTDEKKQEVSEGSTSGADRQRKGNTPQARYRLFRLLRAEAPEVLDDIVAKCTERSYDASSVPNVPGPAPPSEYGSRSSTSRSLGGNPGQAAGSAAIFKQWEEIRATLMRGHHFKKHALEETNTAQNRMIFLTTDNSHVCAVPTSENASRDPGSLANVAECVQYYGPDTRALAANKIQFVNMGVDEDFVLRKKDVNPEATFSIVSAKQKFVLECKNAEEAQFFHDAWQFFLYHSKPSLKRYDVAIVERCLTSGGNSDPSCASMSSSSNNNNKTLEELLQEFMTRKGISAEPEPESLEDRVIRFIDRFDPNSLKEMVSDILSSFTSASPERKGDPNECIEHLESCFAMQEPVPPAPFPTKEEELKFRLKVFAWYHIGLVGEPTEEDLERLYEDLTLYLKRENGIARMWESLEFRYGPELHAKIAFTSTRKTWKRPPKSEVIHNQQQQQSDDIRVYASGGGREALLAVVEEIETTCLKWNRISSSRNPKYSVTVSSLLQKEGCFDTLLQDLDSLKKNLRSLIGRSTTQGRSSSSSTTTTQQAVQALDQALVIYKRLRHSLDRLQSALFAESDDEENNQKEAGNDHHDLEPKHLEELKDVLVHLKADFNKLRNPSFLRKSHPESFGEQTAECIQAALRADTETDFSAESSPLVVVPSVEKDDKVSGGKIEESSMETDKGNGKQRRRRTFSSGSDDDEDVKSATEKESKTEDAETSLERGGSSIVVEGDDPLSVSKPNKKVSAPSSNEPTTRTKKSSDTTTGAGRSSLLIINRRGAKEELMYGFGSYTRKGEQEMMNGRESQVNTLFSRFMHAEFQRTADLGPRLQLQEVMLRIFLYFDDDPKLLIRASHVSAGWRERVARLPQWALIADRGRCSFICQADYLAWYYPQIAEKQAAKGVIAPEKEQGIPNGIKVPAKGRQGKKKCVIM